MSAAEMHSRFGAAVGVACPVFGFSHTPAVVAAISRAGGMGVLGTALLEPVELDRRLSWLEETLDGRPYGVDIVLPAGSDRQSATTIPDEHRVAIHTLARRVGIPLDDVQPGLSAPALDLTPERARAALDVVEWHSPSLIVNGLGPPSAALVERAHARGVAVAGMVGRREHVQRQIHLGVDAIIAVGTEAAGHAGDITSMVLVPQVVEEAGSTPVLAAGGIASGAQMAAALALGADGVWVGSLWLASEESDVDPIVKGKALAASSADTVRSPAFTGIPSRRLRTAWTDALTSAEAPEPLPVPLQGRLLADADAAIQRHRVPAAMGTPVGQVVGMLNASRPVADLLTQLVSEARRAHHSVTARLGGESA